MRREHLEDQQRSREEMNQLLGIDWEMAMVVAKLEKRLAKAKIPVEASKPKHVPPLPLLPIQFAHVLTASPSVGMYEI